MAEYSSNRLRKLSGSHYDIVDGEPDIRGWDVRDTAGKKIGEVDDLLFEEETRRVRYLVVDLDDNELDIDNDKDVFVPIGIAQLHDRADDVILPGVTADQLRELPEYDEDRFDNGHETSVRNVFAGLGGAALVGGVAGTGEFYNHEHYNDDNLYCNRRTGDNDTEATIPVIQEELNVGKCEVEKGGVRLRSRVVMEEVSEDVNLRNETARVERVPVDRLADERDLRETEAEVREYEEVPVVAKEARVVEEIKLSKDVTERDETISDTVRNTEVDIDRDDDVRTR